MYDKNKNTKKIKYIINIKKRNKNEKEHKSILKQGFIKKEIKMILN